MGVPVPQYPITRPFGSDAVAPDYITLPIPVPSQQAILVGAASFEDAFPPLTMSDIESQGGTPAYGQDMNGILFMITAYIACLGAGQAFPFNATVAAAIGGYAIGANLAKTDGSGFWFNTVDGNTSDPEGLTPVGWVGWSPAAASTGYVSAVVPSGTSNDFNPTGFNFSTNVLDLNPNAGNAIITSLQAGRDGQRIVVTNINGSNNLQFPALTGPTAANQFRGSGLTLLPGDSMQILYTTGVSKWLQI